MRRVARVDGNHAEIVRALRDVGCAVADTSRLGRGFPDLVVGRGGVNYLLEVKDGRQPPSKRQLTPDEATWHERWTGQVATVATVDEALAAVGVAFG